MAACVGIFECAKLLRPAHVGVILPSGEVGLLLLAPRNLRYSALKGEGNVNRVMHMREEERQEGANATRG